MDSLNKYKEVWQNQGIENPLDKNSLNKLIHKRSSSIVKWIFYVSLFEFGFVLLLNLIIPTDWEQYKTYGLYHFMIGVSVFGYALTLLFIFLFYKNYKNISVHESTKDLMQNILNTRKTVKYYILINLIFIAFALFYSFYVIFNSDEYESLMTNLGENGPILLWSIVVFAILFVVGIMFLFYSLLYGLLIKKLNKNYKELTEEV